MRDAHNVASQALDRALAVEKRPQEEANQAQTQDRLLALAEAFAKFAGKAKKIEVLDVEENQDSLHGEWQEELQEGESLGEPESSEEEGQPSPGTGT